MHTRKSSSSSSNYPVLNPPQYPLHGYPPNDNYPPNNNGGYPPGVFSGGASYPQHNSPPYPPAASLYPSSPLYPAGMGGGSLRYPAGRYASAGGGLPTGGPYPMHSPPGNGLSRGSMGPAAAVGQPYPSSMYPAAVGSEGHEEFGRQRGGWPQQQPINNGSSNNNYHEEVQFPPQVSTF